MAWTILVLAGPLLKSVIFLLQPRRQRKPATHKTQKKTLEKIA